MGHGKPFSVKNHLPFIRLFQIIQAAKKSGLSRTAGAYYGDNISLLNGKIDPFEHGVAAKGFFTPCTSSMAQALLFRSYWSFFSPTT